MAAREPIQCYTEEDVPAYALLFLKCVVNPNAGEDPVMLVEKYGQSGDYTTMVPEPSSPNEPPPNDNPYRLPLNLPWHYNAISTIVPGVQWDFYGSMFGGFILANGPTAVPKNTSFGAYQPAFYPCWMLYDDPDFDELEPDEETGIVYDTSILFQSQEGTEDEPEKAFSIVPLGDSSLINPAEPSMLPAVIFQRYGLRDRVRKAVCVMAVKMLFTHYEY